MAEPRSIHLVPIGGTAMTPLAALLAEEGHRVTGSALDLYPPMSTLSSRFVEVAKGLAAEHVPASCDVVVVGNAALRDNVEAAEAKRRGIAVLSMPQAIRAHLLPGKTSVVVTGTHGKTTTSAPTAWLLMDSGRDPGFLIGGEMKNLGRGYRRGAGHAFVLEGDEYNAAFFDRGPVPPLRAPAPLRRKHRVRPRGPLPTSPGRRRVPPGRRDRAPEGVVVAKRRACATSSPWRARKSSPSR